MTVSAVAFNGTPLMQLRRVSKSFPVGSRGLNPFARTRLAVSAMDDVSLDIMAGEALAIVGESGCGKSTTARVLAQLVPQDDGQVFFAGEPVQRNRQSLRAFRRHVQVVFQDSFASLNPRMTIEESIAFGPKVHGVAPAVAQRRARELLARVGLEPQRYAMRYPHELSGGQRQRVNIARALAIEPRLLILDEPVSALDKSVEAQVLNLLDELKTEFGLTYLFISHDLHVVRHLCDRIAVMYLGRIVESGTVEQVLDRPRHPYTRALLNSIPSGDCKNRIEEAPLAGDPPSPIDPPPGCRFHPRCAFAQPVCGETQPALGRRGDGHAVACLRWQAGSEYIPAADFPDLSGSGDARGESRNVQGA